MKGGSLVILRSSEEASIGGREGWGGVEVRSERGHCSYLGDTGAWARLAGTEMERRDGFGSSSGDRQIW